MTNTKFARRCHRPTHHHQSNTAATVTTTTATVTAAAGTWSAGSTILNRTSFAVGRGRGRGGGRLVSGGQLGAPHGSQASSLDAVQWAIRGAGETPAVLSPAAPAPAPAAAESVRSGYREPARTDALITVNGSKNTEIEPGKRTYWQTSGVICPDNHWQLL